MGGVADSTCVDDSIRCLDFRSRIGSRTDAPFAAEGKENEEGETVVESLWAELTKLVEKNKEGEDLSFTKEGVVCDGGEDGRQMTQVAARAAQALHAREQSDSEMRLVLQALDESHLSLAEAEEVSAERKGDTQLLVAAFFFIELES